MLQMNGASVSALAAIGGSVIGGLTPLVSNYLIQRSQTGREIRFKEIAVRQSLYAEFIQFATKLYVSARTKQLDDLDELIALYALISRLRLIASAPVIEAAEAFAGETMKRYGEANLTIEDIRNVALTPHVDPLNIFSTRCREELSSLLGHK
jgi:hypothetical protein